MNEYEFPEESRDEEETLKADEELEEYRIHADDLPQPSLEKCETKRRSWGGLNDSTFDPVELPNSLDAGVQTT
ncbi:unnamed protein product [Strongylus vulgaris]|uniref:Uncharacterized protein n=1 Tax=Strongylus vulgaris TaxID=40348 RepID=A0A3P7J5B7_STRVU|nr:unnamed protein product [Strongylus vulgaris]